MNERDGLRARCGGCSARCGRCSFLHKLGIPSSGLTTFRVGHRETGSDHSRMFPVGCALIFYDKDLEASAFVLDIKTLLLFCCSKRRPTGEQAPPVLFSKKRTKSIMLAKRVINCRRTYDYDERTIPPHCFVIGALL